MINYLKISHLRNNELLQFFNDISARCAQVNQDDLQISDSVTALNNSIAKLSEVYNKETASDVTEELTAIDARRDSDMVGIKTICEGFTYDRDKQKATAANLILKSITKQGKMLHRLNYKAQTTVIDAIIKDWKDSTELQGALETLNLTGWASILEAENEKFSSTYQSRVDDKLKSVGLSFSELRVEAASAYKTLCDRIYAYSIINPGEAYSQLSDAFNLIISDYNQIIERRDSLQKDEAEQNNM